MQATAPQVVLDDFGLVRAGERWVALSGVQEALLRPLLEHAGTPVARAELAAIVWPDGEPPRALDVAMAKLRAKVASFGITIHTIRGRGFLLTCA